MKKSELRAKLNRAMRKIDELEEELDRLDRVNENFMLEIIGLKKERKVLQLQLDELRDRNKLKNYIAQARQLHGVAAHERNRAKDRFIELRQQLERAEKAAMELLDAISAPAYRALQAKDEE